MSKVEDYWKDLSLQAKAKGIKKSVDDVERVWRSVTSELDKEGITPDNMRYRQMLINRTREKVMKESKFELFLELEKLDKDKYQSSDMKCPKCGHKKVLEYPKQKMYECKNCNHAWQKKD
jgi:DNA-directed RNA polymerase subunit M/transcription elongation factor TFIIS